LQRKSKKSCKVATQIKKVIAVCNGEEQGGAHHFLLQCAMEKSKDLLQWQWKRAFKGGASFSIAVCNGKEHSRGCIIFYCSVQWKRAFKGVHHFLLQWQWRRARRGASFSIAVCNVKERVY